jgi:hypothetical protein
VHYVRHVAGAFAVVTNTLSSKYTSFEDTSLVSLRTGATRPLAVLQRDYGALTDLDTLVARAFATAGGRAVATITAPDEVVRVVALGTRGTLRTLAEATRTELLPDSLSLVGSRAAWTQSGRMTSANLP